MSTLKSSLSYQLDGEIRYLEVFFAAKKRVFLYGGTGDEYTGPKKPPIRRFGNRESGIKKPLLSDFLVCRFWARGNHHSRE